MRVKIYQIDPELDVNRVKFMSLDMLQKTQDAAEVDPRIYQEVFNAEIDETEPEEIYARFNTDGHPLFRGHSLSVSDVVVTDDGALFCDTVGFTKIPFDESKANKPADLMRIVYVEPHRWAYSAEVLNSLEAEQKAVGGYIEPIYNDDGTCLVGNEEAKLIGMEGNRHLDWGGVIAGPIFVCGTTEDDFRSLTQDEEEKYLTKYARPEFISQQEVQADTGFILYGF